MIVLFCFALVVSSFPDLCNLALMSAHLEKQLALCPYRLALAGKVLHQSEILVESADGVHYWGTWTSY